MSHPAASIKSIFSGKIGLDTPDYFDSDYDDRNSVNVTYREDQEDDEASSLSQNSNHSVNSKNLSTLESKLRKKFQQNSTPYQNSSDNGSFGSNDNGSYAYDNTPLTSAGQEDSASLQYDSVSRPLSRNSTTSCLSTTATKDGIEGKRFHRHGPSQYSSNVIANMFHHQQSHSHTKGEVDNLVKPAIIRSLGVSEVNGSDSNQSQVSIKTTDAEIDGHGGLGGRFSYLENAVNTAKPLTLKEKINLLNAEVNSDS